jgi:hypothetical protein
VTTYYGGLLDDPARESVSLHLMLAESSKHSATKLLHPRAFPSAQWYDRVLLKEFDPKTTLYFVVSDDPDLAADFMASFGDLVNFVILRENSVVSLHLMSRCTHHVLTSSTLSFWGGSRVSCLPPD